MDSIVHTSSLIQKKEEILYEKKRNSFFECNMLTFGFKY